MKRQSTSQAARSSTAPAGTMRTTRSAQSRRRGIARCNWREHEPWSLESRTIAFYLGIGCLSDLEILRSNRSPSAWELIEEVEKRFNSTGEHADG